MRSHETSRRKSRLQEPLRAGLPIFAAMLCVGVACSQELRSSASEQLDERSVVTDRGFVFIGGSYVPPPYVIQRDGATVTLNGHSFTEHDLDLSGYQEDIDELAGNTSGRGMAFQQRHFGRHGHGKRHVFPWRTRPDTSLSMLFEDALISLTNVNDVIVLFADKPPLLLEETREGYDLLKRLTESDLSRDGGTGIPDTLFSEDDRESWTRLVSEFQPTAAFLQRATKQVEVLETIAETSERTSSARIWIDQITHPLTVVAMIVVFLAFGHLLSSKPSLPSLPETAGVSLATRATVVRSLLIVGLLSVVDLIWTVAAARIGSVSGYNSLGSQWIDDPMELIVIKTVVASTAIGLLYWLQHRPAAQVVSWWTCLALTVLTARWLTINSMVL